METVRFGKKTFHGYDEEAYKNARAAYDNRERELTEQFKQDAFKYFDIVNHPKAELLYSIAWEKGHSCGLSEVLGEMSEMLELIK